MAKVIFDFTLSSNIKKNGVEHNIAHCAVSVTDMSAKNMADISDVYAIAARHIEKDIINLIDKEVNRMVESQGGEIIRSGIITAH